MNTFLKRWETILASVFHPPQARGSPIVSSMSSVFRSNLRLFPFTKTAYLRANLLKLNTFPGSFLWEGITVCSPKSQPLRLEMGI